MVSLKTIFFRFLQIRSYVQNQSSYTMSSQNSQIEILLLHSGKKSILGQGYTKLVLASSRSSEYLRELWNKDFGITMDETRWAEVWKVAKEISICNRTKESQFRILHRLQITPQLRHKMNPKLTEMCSKCNIRVGNYNHCVWSCVHIEDYWGKIVEKLNLIFNVHLDIEPQTLLLGLPSPQIKGFYQRRLFSVLTFAATKNILLNGVIIYHPQLQDGTE